MNSTVDFAELKPFLEAIAEQSAHADSTSMSLDRFSALFLYVFLPYGLATLLVALLLNRTAVLASVGAGGRLLRRSSWKTRVPRAVTTGALRLAAAYLLLKQMYHVLVALSVVGQRPGEWSLLTRLASRFLVYRPSDWPSGSFMGMPRDEVRLGPTASMFWPIFWSTSFSLFAETLCNSVGGKRPNFGSGVSFFELLLAFQEMSTGFMFLQDHPVAKRPTEPLLVICLFVMAEHLHLQVGALLYKNKYRLVPLAVCNLCFLVYFVRLSVMLYPVSIFCIYFNLVCVLAVVVVSAAVFALAVAAKGALWHELLYSVYFSGDESLDFFSKHLGVSLADDFYSATCNAGLFAISSAGKSSYITEYNYVSAQLETWLEKGVWAGIGRTFNVSSLSRRLPAVQSGRVLAYLRENNISGYGNVVATPLQRMISGNPPKAAGSILGYRFMYTREIVVRAVTLAYALFKLLLHMALVAFKKYVLKRAAHRRQDYESVRLRAPPFVRSLMQRPASRKEVFSLRNVTDEELAAHYGVILTEKELEEEDTLPDYEVEEEESDSDDELEADASELLDVDTLVELMGNRVLEHHLRHDPAKGALTRLHFTGAGDGREDQLLAVLLRRRPGPDADDGDVSDPRLACVICQVNLREIITWPCKCFAICESCRLSLVSTGMEGCVCCRRDVEGVSRVYLP